MAYVIVENFGLNKDIIQKGIVVGEKIQYVTGEMWFEVEIEEGHIWARGSDIFLTLIDAKYGLMQRVYKALNDIK